MACCAGSPFSMDFPSFFPSMGGISQPAMVDDPPQSFCSASWDLPLPRRPSAPVFWQSQLASPEGPQKRAPKKISTRNSSCGFSPSGSRWLSCWLPSFGKSLLLLVFPAPSLAKIKVEKGHHSKAGSWRVSYMPKFSGFPEAS